MTLPDHIPQHVRYRYLRVLEELEREYDERFWADMYRAGLTGGVLEQVERPDEYNAFRASRTQVDAEHETRKRELWEKILGPYGLPYPN